MIKPAEERVLNAIFGTRKHKMRVRIKDGTPQSGKSLCMTCRDAGIVKGQNGEVVVHCRADMFSHLRGNVPFRVYECTAYNQINSLDKWEMEKIAWVIEARHRGPKGFEVPEGEDIMEVTVTKPKKSSNNPINWPDE